MLRMAASSRRQTLTALECIVRYWGNVNITSLLHNTQTPAPGLR